MAGTAHAFSSYLTAFNSRYSTGGTVLNTCQLCHNTSPPTLSFNAYGLNVQDQVVNLGNPIATGLANIEPLDSDADGYSNIVEINARTFPGDPNSHPTAGITPVRQRPRQRASDARRHHHQHRQRRAQRHQPRCHRLG
jgi:hypothetical protein